MNQRLFAIAALAGLLAGCSTTTPNYDKRFGEAVRDARKKMTVNPDAGKNPDPVTGMDGRASRETMVRYKDSFKAPPPAVNVINIGGAIGGK
jgi:hypothetical protein